LEWNRRENGEEERAEDMKSGIMAYVATTAAAWTSIAFASSVDVSFSNITKSAASNLTSQLKMTVSDVAGEPSKVDFTFRNLVGLSSSIKDIYFDAGAPGGFFVGGKVFTQSGSDFKWGAGGAAEMPGSNKLSPAFSSTLNLGASAGSGDASLGLDQVADTLVLRMSLADGKSFNDIINALITSPLKAGAVRVGLNVASIGPGGDNDSYVSNLLVVPLPPAAWGGLGCLAAVIGAGVLRSRTMRLGA